MKHLKLLTLMILVSISTQASTTLPIQGKVIKPTDKNIQYVGRICFDHPERPRFTFPGTQIIVRLIKEAVPQAGSHYCCYEQRIEERVQNVLGYFLPAAVALEDEPAKDESGDKQE